MGAIKESKLANGNVGLEITYGGKEAPFGGVDSSAPPAYIDPRCFTDCDGFIVVDNKLVAASLNPIAVPVLWNGTVGVQLIGFGNFYNPIYGTLNYALGYTAVAVSGTPTGVTYTFYMTSWAPGSIATVYNDTLTTTQYNSVTPAVAASITLQLQTLSIGTAGSGATVTITSVGTYSHPGFNDGGFSFDYSGAYIEGIITGITVTGGSSYRLNDIYYVQQGTNVTGQVQITSLGAGGSITGVTIVSNSFTVADAYINGYASTAGQGYNTTDSASLEYSGSTNVKLQISGPGGVNTYTVANGGEALIVPSGVIGENGFAGAEHFTFIKTASGAIMGANNWDGHSTGAFYGYASIGSAAGFNYSVGQFYTVSQLGLNGVTADTAIIQVTGIGAGGILIDFDIVSTGLTSAGYIPIEWETEGTHGVTLVPAAVPTLNSGTSYILNQLAAEINGTAQAPYNVIDPNVSATVNTTASTLTLTATPAYIGTIGNSISVLDLSQITGTSLYYYYFPVRTPPGAYLTGGNDGTSTGTVLQTVLPTQASIASVGGTLYIANIGPFIIKYEKPGVLVMSSTYLGVQVLRKFGGSLIGLGYINAPGGSPPGSFVSSTSMVFAWSATNDLDIWNPLDLNGNVTGAGFAQLADVGDYLSGLVVSSGTAFIIRSQGMSYATATGNATNPFSFNHLGLGDCGEGMQIGKLLCQYDQIGLYVGNSNIFQLAGQIAAIGDKIKHNFFQVMLANSAALYGSAACSVDAEDENLLVLFVIGARVFIYNFANGTWQTMTLNALLDAATYLSAGVFASSNASLANNVYNQSNAIIVYGRSNVYSFYSVSDTVAKTGSFNQSSYVKFPVEEISFGRDITVDSLFVALVENTTSSLFSIVFTVSGSDPTVPSVTYTLTLTSTNGGSAGAPAEFQIFPDAGIPFTGHSPQLAMNVILYSEAAQVYFTKIAMFGSYDPNQRPV